MDTIKNDLEDQIGKTNKVFEKYFGKLNLSSGFNPERLDEDILSVDIELLENVLKKVTRQFKIGRIVSVVIVAILLLFTLFILLNDLFFNLKIEHAININFLSVIIISLVLLKSATSYYKVKVNLEHKIYLCRLLDKISQREN